MALPVIDRSALVSELSSVLPPLSSTWHSFYSSVTGTITTDPTCMVVPLDDHMVHRGHAVFDTANVAHGKAYGLSFHIERFLRSARMAQIHHNYTADALKEIILATIAAGGSREDTLVRYWMSAGRGDFGISPKGCPRANFYVVCVEYKGKVGLLKGVKECTVDVPLKPRLLAELKSTNYLLNALTTMEAESKGGYCGIQVHPDGRIAESSIANVAIVDQDGFLRGPPFEGILRGTTLIRAGALAEALVTQGTLQGVDFTRPVHVDEVARAREMIGFGGGGCYPIIEFNGVAVGDGTLGPVFQYLYDATIADYNNPEFTDDVPYELYPRSTTTKSCCQKKAEAASETKSCCQKKAEAASANEEKLTCCQKKALAAAAAAGGADKPKQACGICGSTKANCTGVKGLLHALPVFILGALAGVGFSYYRARHV